MNFISTSGKKSDNELEVFAWPCAEDGSYYVPENLRQISDSEIENMTQLDPAMRMATIFSFFIEDLDVREVSNRLSEYFESNPCFTLHSMNKYLNEEFIFEAWHNQSATLYDFVFFSYKILLEELMKKNGKQDEIAYLLFCPGNMALSALNILNSENLILFSRSKYVDISYKNLLNSYKSSNKLLHLKTACSLDEINDYQKSLYSRQTIKKIADKEAKFLAVLSSHSWGHILICTSLLIYIYTELYKYFKDNELSINSFDFAIVETSLDFSLASCYAKAMGIDIHKFLLINNQNRSASEFIRTGKYNACHKISNNFLPYIDNLMPANLERFIYELSYRDENMVKEMTLLLEKNKRFDFSRELLSPLKKYFSSKFIKDHDVQNRVTEIYDRFDQFMDPATAIMISSMEELRSSHDKKNIPIVYLSMMSPQLFPILSAKALGIKKSSDKTYIHYMEEIEKESSIEIPDIYKVNFDDKNFLPLIKKEEIEDRIISFLKGEDIVDSEIGNVDIQNNDKENLEDK